MSRVTIATSSSWGVVRRFLPRPRPSHGDKPGSRLPGCVSPSARQRRRGDERFAAPGATDRGARLAQFHPNLAPTRTRKPAFRITLDFEVPASRPTRRTSDQSPRTSRRNGPQDQGAKDEPAARVSIGKRGCLVLVLEPRHGSISDLFIFQEILPVPRPHVESEHSHVAITEPDVSPEWPPQLSGGPPRRSPRCAASRRRPG
jgi:hypothetical protein